MPTIPLNFENRPVLDQNKLEPLFGRVFGEHLGGLVQFFAADIEEPT